MPASFPNSIKTFTTKVDGVDDVEAAHINDLQLEIEALETCLISGWYTDQNTWTYVSATSFRVSGDQRVRFPIGTKIKLTQTTVKYFYVIDTSYSSPNTTVTITGGSDYALANAAITSPDYSYAAAPQGFPQWFNYTPFWSATTTNPTVGNGSVLGVFTINGRLCTVSFRIVIGSTTALGTGNYGITMPVSANTLGLIHIGSVHCNQPSVANYIASARLLSGSFVDFPLNPTYLSHNNPVSWASGSSINGSIQYPI